LYKPFSVAAYNFLEFWRSIARAGMSKYDCGPASGSPELDGFQSIPPFVVLKMPQQSNATYRELSSWGSITNTTTKRLPGRPTFTGFQLAPPSVVLKTPLSWVATYTVLG